VTRVEAPGLVQCRQRLGEVSVRSRGPWMRGALVLERLSRQARNCCHFRSPKQAQVPAAHPLSSRGGSGQKKKKPLP
jgi:hypothetical protein